MKLPFQNQVCYFLLIICFSISLNAQTLTLEKAWETPADLKTPESVIYDAAHEVLYVSNINNHDGGHDGNGSIARVSLKGEILEVEWVVGGMDAPKGLGLFEGLLYVADIANVVVIDTKTGTLLKSIEVEDPGMLNDITIDEDGTVYVSDSDNAKIYRIKNDKAEVWMDKNMLQPNGLLAHENRLYMVDMGNGIFYEIMKDTKKLLKIAEGFKVADGITPYGEDFIISNWAGEVYHVKTTGEVEKLLDTKADEINAADIQYLSHENLLLIPTYFANNLAGYKIIEK